MALGRRVTGQLAQLLLDLDEIEALERAVADAIVKHSDNLLLLRSASMREVISTQLTLLNSLRTALAEARMGLERTRG